MADAFRRGGRLLALGNGGSATSAADMVTELMVPPPDGSQPLPALCLTNDIAVVTGVGNDVGFNDIFVRQIIALARPHDVVRRGLRRAATPRTSCAGFAEARRRGLCTIAICGYDGGRMAREQ